MSGSTSVVQPLVNLHAQLNHRDGRLEFLEGSNYYPGRGIVQEAREMASLAEDAAEEFAAQFPERRRMIRRLEGNAAELTRVARELFYMNVTQTTYGPGWGSRLDDNVMTVQGALLAAVSACRQAATES